MDKFRATEVREHLLDAAMSLDEARAIMADEMPDERSPLAELREVEGVFYKLLRAFAVRYPEVPLPEELPHIISLRRWEDVILPEQMSEADLDSIIFSMLKSQWQKTAKVVGLTVTECKKLLLPVTGEMIAARIQALVNANRLEGAGDLRKWRHSEVRLKPSATPRQKLAT